MGLAICFPFLLGFFSLFQPCVDPTVLEKKNTIETRVYRIPAFQSFMITTGVSEKGGVMGSMYGGNVTASFPEGITILRTASSKNEDEAIQLIKEEISSYPCSCGDYIQIIPLDRNVISSVSRTVNQTFFKLHHMIPGRRSSTGEFWFSVQMKGVERQKALINFRGDAIYWHSLRFNDSGRIEKEKLFNETIEVNKDETVLVGFVPPKADGGSRGSAFWFGFKISESFHP